MSLIASSQLIVIIGLGVTGLSAARFLKKKNIQFIMMDSRETPPNLSVFQKEFPDVSCLLGQLDSEVLAHADEIIISPGMSLETPELLLAANAGIPIIGDIELFARYVDKPVIAITGSNAKSTVTTLVGKMFAACDYTVAVGGNLGVPVLELLEQKSIDFFVLELSSFQLETTSSLKPKVATILNISLDHMDRYSGLPDYHQAKQRIYRHAENIVINRQDVLTHPPLAKNASVWTFGDDQSDRNGFGLMKKGAGHSVETYLTYQFSVLLQDIDVSLKGKHNSVNILAALAIGTAANLPMNKMLDVVKGFRGLAHRCEYISTRHHVVYINDSKATNVGATIAALSGLGSDEKNIVLIAGGDAKGADFSPLVDVVARYVRDVVLIGCDAELLEAALQGVAPIHHAHSLEAAVDVSASLASKDNIVLLSPACASFDMFDGFEDRGNQFIQCVRGKR